MKPVLVVASAVFLAGAVLPAPAQAPERQVIPGADGMTPAEREAYRASKLVGDPARGAKLHSGCFGCHGVERYTAPLTYVAASFVDSLLRASGLSDLPPAPPTLRTTTLVTPCTCLGRCCATTRASTSVGPPAE